ncbi:hypothetical protein UFOVP275_8 [uncultured Caudovirales phage]|uniref:Uncharacterized protein n=1 Tax=uncultured Caudovirales phage TaxID=2100421 RepID=A0A6J5LSN8_9CAUD|nr:hypothetical protein UFOVP275_8 [uncultured Caudovirales phage]
MNTSLLKRCLDVIRNGGATYDIDECVKDLEAAIAEQKDPISHYARGFTDAMHKAEQAKLQEPAPLGAAMFWHCPPSAFRNPPNPTLQK